MVFMDPMDILKVKEIYDRASKHDIFIIWMHSYTQKSSKCGKFTLKLQKHFLYSVSMITTDGNQELF